MNESHRVEELQEWHENARYELERCRAELAASQKKVKYAEEHLYFIEQLLRLEGAEDIVALNLRLWKKISWITSRQICVKLVSRCMSVNSMPLSLKREFPSQV